MRRGRVAEAIAHYRRGIAIDPVRARYLHRPLAVAHEELGQVDDAVAEYRRAVRANKRDLAHVFAAKVTREQFAGQRIDEVTDTILDGAIAPLVLRLVQKGKFSTTEIEHFRSLLADAERRAAEATEKKRR